MHLHLLNVLAGLAWDPQIRGFLIVVGGGRDAARQHLPAACHQRGCSHGLPPRHRRDHRVDDDARSSPGRSTARAQGSRPELEGAGSRALRHRHRLVDGHADTRCATSPRDGRNCPRSARRMLGDAAGCGRQLHHQVRPQAEDGPRRPDHQGPDPRPAALPRRVLHSRINTSWLGGYDKGGDNCLGRRLFTDFEEDLFGRSPQVLSSVTRRTTCGAGAPDCRQPRRRRRRHYVHDEARHRRSPSLR